MLLVHYVNYDVKVFMNAALIYKLPSSPTQSGKKHEKMWVLKYVKERKDGIDPVMGWITSSEPIVPQVIIKFKSKDEAVYYAKSIGVSYKVVDAHEKQVVKPKSYLDAFKYKG